MSTPAMTDHEMILEIWADVKDLKKESDVVRKSLFGNGGVGLLAKHETLAVQVGNIITAIGSRDKLATYIGGALFLLVLGLLWRLFTGEISIIFN